MSPVRVPLCVRRLHRQRPQVQRHGELRRRLGRGQAALQES